MNQEKRMNLIHQMKREKRIRPKPPMEVMAVMAATVVIVGATAEVTAEAMGKERGKYHQISF